MKIKAKKASPHNIQITGQVKADLKLHKSFLSIANKGVSLNLLTFRKPDHFMFGDACEHGLGDFHGGSGRAYAWLIPYELRGRDHINVLEFLSQLIQIWIDVLEGRIKSQDCILACGDNTSTMGWLWRPNFRETAEHDEESNLDWLVKQKVARKLAGLLLTSGAVLY